MESHGNCVFIEGTAKRGYGNFIDKLKKLK